MKRVIAAFAALLAPLAQGSAEDWPSRPITMVIPLAAGGGSDGLIRVFTPRLGELLGQQVIVENAGGAGGMIGAARVAKAPPDGYQLLLGTSGTQALNQSIYERPLYNAATDFAPVALIFEVPQVLITRKDFPAGNLQEFIAYARANQATLQYGSSGAGGTGHLACALLNAAIGVKVTHVPYRGGGPAMQDLIAGQLHYVCLNFAGAFTQIAGKALKGIALLGQERSPLLPALATAHKQGLANVEALTWNAFFLPKSTPAPIVKKLNDAVIDAMDSAAVKERMHDLGVSLVAPERRTPDYLQKFVADEIAKWAGPIKAAGISLD